MSGTGPVPLMPPVPSEVSNHWATAGKPALVKAPASMSCATNVGYSVNAAPTALDQPYDQLPSGLTPLGENVLARLSQGPLGNGTPPSGQAVTSAVRGTCT